MPPTSRLSHLLYSYLPSKYYHSSLHRSFQVAHCIHTLVRYSWKSLVCTCIVSVYSFVHCTCTHVPHNAWTCMIHVCMHSTRHGQCISWDKLPCSRLSRKVYSKLWLLLHTGAVGSIFCIIIIPYKCLTKTYIDIYWLHTMCVVQHMCHE